MDLSPAQPNVEFMTAESFFDHSQDGIPTGGEHVFTILPELFGAQSRGSVKLQSADALALPVVDCGYLDDPLDLEVLAEACRLANEIVLPTRLSCMVRGQRTFSRARGHHRHLTTSFRQGRMDSVCQEARNNATTHKPDASDLVCLKPCLGQHGLHAVFRTQPFADNACLLNPLGYHASGTCAMGKDSDVKAVVDENLGVKGVDGLRVVDCSIMPVLVGGHSQMPAYGIGEKAADLIKATWGLRSAP